MGWERESSPLEATFAAFFAEVEAAPQTAAEPIAAAFRRHLAGVAVEALPVEARQGWMSAMGLLGLRTAADLPPDPVDLDRRLSGMQAWPAARLDLLLRALGVARAGIDVASDKRWNDTIREQVAKAYL